MFGFVVDDRLARDLRTLSTLTSRSCAAPARAGACSPPPCRVSCRRAARHLPRAPTRPVEEGLIIGGVEYDSCSCPSRATRRTRSSPCCRSLDEALAPSRRLRALLAVLLAGSIAASVVGSVLIARGVTRPLFRLSQVTQRIEEGDYKAPVETGGPDEVRELARRFELMREAIAAREAQILRLAYRDRSPTCPTGCCSTTG